MVDESGEGQTARTRYRVIDRAGNSAAWVELQPLTGRTHQLRVSSAALGAPILGDAAYGEVGEGGRNTAPIDGLSDMLHLHARSLTLPHPAGGRLTIEAELPPHMVETFAGLGFVAPAARPPRRQ
jgi:23S rRNA pseudouridine955/2504/2580 synthase